MANAWEQRGRGKGLTACAAGAGRPSQGALRGCECALGAQAMRESRKDREAVRKGTHRESHGERRPGVLRVCARVCVCTCADREQKAPRHRPRGAEAAGAPGKREWSRTPHAGRTKDRGCPLHPGVRGSASVGRWGPSSPRGDPQGLSVWSPPFSPPVPSFTFPPSLSISQWPSWPPGVSGLRWHGGATSQGNAQAAKAAQAP